MSDFIVDELDVQRAAYALAVSPAFERDRVCFSARISGLYRSIDGGASWQSAYDSLLLTETLATTAVALSPAFERDHSVFAGVNGGVLRSSDGGATWRTVMLPKPPPLVSVLAVSPNFAQDNTLLAGTLEDGVFCSTDGGEHWTLWNFGLLDLNVLALAISPDFARDETVFAGTSTGIFRSTNGGRAWREVGFLDAFAPVLSLALSPNYDHDGILYAGTEAEGLFCSTDQGKTWTHLVDASIPNEVPHIVINGQGAASSAPLLPDTVVLVMDGATARLLHRP